MDNDPSEVVTICVFAPDGSQVLRKEVQGHQGSIPISLQDAPPGLYYLEIATETGSFYTTKVVVKD